MPRLESSPAINRLPSWLSGTIAAIGIGCVAAIWYYIDGWSAILFGIVFLIASVAVFSFLTYCLGTHWPHGITTVGHLTRAIAPFDVSDGPPGQRLLTHMKVLEEVRRLTAEQLGLPLDKVRAESDFVHDLKID